MSKEKILLATNNQGKITEFLFYINFFKIFKNIEIVTLENFHQIGEPQENQLTFEDNANLKSSFFYTKSGVTSLSDDSGFIIDDSDAFPGVRTARYAKENGGITGAIKSIFEKYNKLEKIPTTFYCSLSLKGNDKNISATGSVQGNLIKKSIGDNGFGYDPYFIPKDSIETFAEMDKQQKLLHSHRYYAFKDLSLKLI